MNTNKKIKKILPITLLLLIFIPLFTYADSIIPNCSPNCGYNDLMQLINNVIGWIVMIAVPVSAGVFAWAGFKLMMTGVVDERKAAKDMMWKVLVGLVFILAAWIIVGTITGSLLSEDYKNSIPVDLKK